MKKNWVYRGTFPVTAKGNRAMKQTGSGKVAVESEVAAVNNVWNETVFRQVNIRQIDTPAVSTEQVDAWTQAQQVVRSFEVEGFGIYNCDRIFSMVNPVLIQAMFKVPGFNWEGYPVFRTEDNALIGYSTNMNYTINISSTRKPVLFALLPNNKLALMTATEYQKVLSETPLTTKNHQYVFSLTIHPEKVNSPDDIRKILGISKPKGSRRLKGAGTRMLRSKQV